MFWTVHLIGWLFLPRLVVFFSGALICSFIWTIFLSWCACYVKRRSLRCSPGWANPRHCVVALYVGKGSKREQWLLLYSLPDFSHFPCHPQAKWALQVLMPVWVGLFTFWDPMGLSNELSCETGSFSHCHLNPHRCFQSEVWGFISLRWSPGLLGLSYYPVIPPGLSARKCGTAHSTICHLTQSASHHFAVSPLHPGCPSLLLLQVWMNVSSSTPWLSDFHTVQFSGSSGCFSFLNLLLSFFWLCEEAQCVHLHLHLVQKSNLSFKVQNSVVSTTSKNCATIIII